MTNFYPSNDLRSKAADFVADKLPGTPAWALFCRWYRHRRVFWFESSSHSLLATVDLDAGTIRMSDRLSERQHGGQTFPVPADWEASA